MPATVSDLPTMGRSGPPSEKPEPVKPEEPKQPEKIEATLETLTVRVPHMTGVTGYVRRRVDVTLTRAQATKLKGVLRALEQDDAKLANGKYVSTVSHVLPWLLDSIGK